MSIDFLKLGICEELANVLKQSGISTPTTVQEKVIPLLLEKHDIITQSQTGTGKTLAFLLPIIQNINPDCKGVQAIVITPTRELAIQITSEVKKLAKINDYNVLAAYGGQDVEQQIRKLKGNIPIVIGTPGRLLDHIRRKTINLNKLSMIVLDEVDEIMERGFLPDVETVMKSSPAKRQTMIFSATISRGVRKICEKYLKKPEQVIVRTRTVILDKITQKVVQTTEKNKVNSLIKIVNEENPFMAIIFCKTKKRASTINYHLSTLGYNCEELQGDMTQSKREKVMKRFRNLKIQYLVATDIAARGLDVEGITHIINYDMPPDTESYIHRIGRTGRAGQAGIAITFSTSSDKSILNSIESGIEVRLEKRNLNKEDITEYVKIVTADSGKAYVQRNQSRDANKNSRKNSSFRSSSSSKSSGNSKTFEKKYFTKSRSKRTGRGSTKK